MIETIYTTVGFLAVYFALPLLWGGKTVGSSVLRFKLTGLGGGVPSWQSLIKRALALYLPWLAGTFLSFLDRMELDINSPFYPIHVWVTVATFAFFGIMVAVLCIHALIVIMKKGERTFYFDYVADLIPRKK